MEHNVTFTNYFDLIFSQGFFFISTVFGSNAEIKAIRIAYIFSELLWSAGLLLGIDILQYARESEYTRSFDILSSP